MTTPRLLAIALLAPLPPALLATQTTPPKSAAAQNAAAGNLITDPSGEIVTLEEFTVSAKAVENNYIVSESTSATRTGENILNLPYNVQVITDEIVQDFQLFDDDQIFALAGGMSFYNYDSDTRESTLRGFKALTTRDGFQFAMPSTPSNTMRTDIIKGPMTTTYGRAAPGGIVNKISRRPSIKPTVNFSATAGTDNFYRASLYGTGPIAPSLTHNKLYYYAYCEYRHTEMNEDFVKADFQYLGGTLLYMFQKTTSLMLTCEYQPSTAHASSGSITYYPAKPGMTPPTIYMDLTGTAATTGYLVPFSAIRYWTGVGNFSKYGPDTKDEQTYWGINALFEHRINKTWSLRAALQTYAKDLEYRRWAGAAYFYEATQRLSERFPTLRTTSDDCIASQLDLNARFATGKVNHRLLLSADAALHDYTDYQYRMNDAVQAMLDPDTRWLDMKNPKYATYNPADLNKEHSITDYNTTAFGALLSYSAKIGPLSLMASGRYEDYSAEVTNKYAVYSGNNTGDGSGNEFTYSIGANCQIPGFGETLVAYANLSTGFLPNNDKIDQGMLTIVPPETSEGIEFGFKGSLLKDKLAYILSFYTIHRTNVSYTNPDYDFTYQGKGTVSQYFSGGEDKSKGFELNISARPITNFTLIAALSYIDSEAVKAAPTQQASIGKPLVRIPKWYASALASYNFPAPLKGFSIGLKATFNDSFVIEYDTPTISQKNAPSQLLLDGFLRYSLGTQKPFKMRHAITLNAFNLLDKQYAVPTTGRPANGIEFRITYNLNF